MLTADDPAEAIRDPGISLLVLAYAGGLAGTVGAACGALAGVTGAAVLWWVAELGLRGRSLVLAAVLLGAGLGWFALDLAAAMGAAPDDDTAVELLVGRAGPAVAGAGGAVWQVARTATGRPRAFR